MTAVDTARTTTVTKLPVRLVVPIALGTLLQALNSSMIAVALVQIRQAPPPIPDCTAPPSRSSPSALSSPCRR